MERQVLCQPLHDVRIRYEQEAEKKREPRVRVGSFVATDYASKLSGV